MKKITVALLLSITFGNQINAQDYGYNKGDQLLNIGVGVNSYYNKGIPLGASYEYGITDVISVGGSFDYLSNKYTVGPSLSYKFTSLYIGARAAYHVNELLNINNEKIDLYGGITAGYRSFGWSDEFSSNDLGNAYGSGIFFGGYIGGRYYFTQRFGAFSEIGAVGSTNFKLGLAVKF